MSRLTDLIAQAKAKDPELAKELEREFKVLSTRRSFGLNFERHRPESVELPGRPVRKGDKVHILSPRGTAGKGDSRLWKVRGFSGKGVKRAAQLELLEETEKENQTVLVDDLVVVAEFRDYIYPGLVSTGKVESGGDKPFHTVINGENFHALEALTFTHRGKIDAIYIDPPYNTGAKDWKYNNDYVDGEDLYRHSKWLAMMERRLLVAKELLNPSDSVLIVTIDEKEFLRLGLLLEQTFPDARIQMISSAINPKGSSRNGFRRSDEYLFVVMFGESLPARIKLSSEWSIYCEETEDPSEDDEAKKSTKKKTPDWTSMMRRGTDSLRQNVPNGFYPIYVDPSYPPRVVDVGDPLPPGVHTPPKKKGLVAVMPIRRNGEEGRWQVVRKSELLERQKQGRIRVGRKTDYGYVINYLPDGAYNDVCSDRFEIQGRDVDGSLIAVKVSDDENSSTDEDRIPTTQWHISSHNASENGTTLINSFLGRLRAFDYSKSLYAVEDTLRFFVSKKPNATIIDFFAGSGTTAHAVMRLNKQDGGKRQCILVTNNEVSSDEQKRLRKKSLRAGDTEWEKFGICDYVTKPRLKAAITGKTPGGEDIKGDYKFTDEFPMSEGFTENAEFFTLTYETPVAVSHNKSFTKIAPLLWMRAGSQGRCIDKIPKEGWAVADTYGLLTDLDASAAFCKAVRDVKDMRVVYIVTNDDRRFQSVTRNLPDTVEPVRLYESYLNNFRFSFGR